MPDANQVEFLPDWYPDLARRKRQLLIATALAGLVGSLVGADIVHTHRQTVAASSALAQLDAARQRVLQTRTAVVKLSRHVDAPRLLAMLDRVMPSDVTLTELTLDAEPTTADLFSLAYLSALRAKPGEANQRVRIQLRGTCGSPAAGANFVAGLSKMPFLQGVLMSDAVDRPADAAVTPQATTDFRVTFWIDRDLPSEE